jgi:hypothetical protein
MAALSSRKLEIVRTLVETVPDRIVGGLQRALADTGGDTVLTSVRQLVEAEVADRTLRNTAFQPVYPLFVGDGSGRHGLVFPVRALGLIWRGLKTTAPHEMAAAAANANEHRPMDPGRIYDSLAVAAAAGLRAREIREFKTAGELCDAAGPNGGEALAACLDISPVVRRALPRLPDWIGPPDDEIGAAARLAYKDAVSVAEDAGPRFFEMLAGQLKPPWMVLRIISAVMDKPTERYLAESELGGFPGRVMADIDESLRAITRMDLDAGPDAGRAAGRLVELITQQAFELEVCIEMTRDHGWGQRIVGQKKALATAVEVRLKDLDKLVAAALPSMQSGFARPRRNAPLLDTAPDPRAVTRATTTLAFAQEVRLCANYGGFSAVHAKTTDKLSATLDRYVEDVLIDVRNGDVADLAKARAFLMIAADFVAFVRDAQAAEFIRRRAASACASPPDNCVVLDA